jgi:NhaP-type Na+/H+ and K+/H+ antiporter
VIFEGFTFGGGVLLGALAGFYGFAVPKAEEETSLAEFVGARLRQQPMLGDCVRLQDINLTVQGLDRGQITRIGLELGGRARRPLPFHRA